VGGAGAFGGGGAFGGAGGFGQSTSSSSSGMPGCTSCADEFMLAGANPSELCSSAAVSWSALTECACVGACSAPCTTSFCAGGVPDTTCNTCLTDTSTSGCGAQLTACESN
jgi:hypothetical protein